MAISILNLKRVKPFQNAITRIMTELSYFTISFGVVPIGVTPPRYYLSDLEDVTTPFIVIRFEPSMKQDSFFIDLYHPYSCEVRRMSYNVTLDRMVINYEHEGDDNSQYNLDYIINHIKENYPEQFEVNDKFKERLKEHFEFNVASLTVLGDGI